MSDLNLNRIVDHHFSFSFFFYIFSLFIYSLLGVIFIISDFLCVLSVLFFLFVFIKLCLIVGRHSNIWKFSIRPGQQEESYIYNIMKMQTIALWTAFFAHFSESKYNLCFLLCRSTLYLMIVY